MAWGWKRVWGGGRPLPPGKRGRILFLGPYNGGVGGIERLTRTFARWAEDSGFTATMVIRRLLKPGPFSIRGTDHVRVLSMRAWSRALGSAVYDYVYVVPAGLKSEVWIPRVKRLVGTKIGLEMDHDSPWLPVFDVFHVEAPREGELDKPHVVATPDPRVTIPDAEPVEAEGDFVLTVFTPYGPEKGAQNVPAFLEGTDRRLVWCYDLSSFGRRSRRWHRGIRAEIASYAHPRLEVRESPSQAELYGLYRASSGYVCFSEREGLGWAILDALAFGKPVCARRIGICRALHDFEATEDFSKPVFRSYEMPPTAGFEGLVGSVPLALAAAKG